jgi:hypothetical protein
MGAFLDSGAWDAEFEKVTHIVGLREKLKGMENAKEVGDSGRY